MSENIIVLRVGYRTICVYTALLKPKNFSRLQAVTCRQWRKL